MLNDRPESSNSTEPTRSLVRHAAQEEEAAKQEEAPSFPPAEDLVKDWQKPDVCSSFRASFTATSNPAAARAWRIKRVACCDATRPRRSSSNGAGILIPIDTGNVIRRVGKQPQLQLEMVYQSLSKVMGTPRSRSVTRISGPAARTWPKS